MQLIIPIPKSSSISELFASKRHLISLGKLASVDKVSTDFNHGKVPEFTAYDQDIGGVWFVSLIDEPPFGAQEFLGKFEQVRWSWLLHNPGD